MALEPIPIEGPGRPLPFELITVPACRFTITVKTGSARGPGPAVRDMSDWDAGGLRDRLIRNEATPAASVEGGSQNRILWD